MRRTTLPAHAQRLDETPGQPGPVGEIGEYTSAGVGDNTTGASREDDLRTRAGILHRESAFRDGRFWP
jgi:hypothetical protein